MPVIVDFPFIKQTDGNLDISLTPSVPIGGWGLEWIMEKRFGGVSGIVEKFAASGFYGSGITLINSGTGVFRIRLDAVDTSGIDYGAYAFTARRTNSGFETTLAEGYVVIQP